MTKTISTTISDEFHDWCKANNIKWCIAINHGIRYLMEGKDIEKELKSKDEAIDKLNIKLREQGSRLWAIEKQLEVKP